MRGIEAAHAYSQAKRTRSLRDQEADVFLRVNAMLRAGQDDDCVTLAKALADNDRLWTSLMDSMRDPHNALPVKMRSSVISIGMAVRREAARTPPDLSFLIGINEQIAAGLTGV